MAEENDIIEITDEDGNVIKCELVTVPLPAFVAGPVIAIEPSAATSEIPALTG